MKALFFVVGIFLLSPFAAVADTPVWTINKFMDKIDEISIVAVEDAGAGQVVVKPNTAYGRFVLDKT